MESFGGRRDRTRWFRYRIFVHGTWIDVRMTEETAVRYAADHGYKGIQYRPEGE